MIAQTIRSVIFVRIEFINSLPVTSNRFLSHQPNQKPIKMSEPGLIISEHDLYHSILVKRKDRFNRNGPSGLFFGISGIYYFHFTNHADALKNILSSYF